jgi:hypothetical protein
MEAVIAPHADAVIGPLIFAPTKLAAHGGVLFVKNNLTLPRPAAAHKMITIKIRINKLMPVRQIVLHI